MSDTDDKEEVVRESRNIKDVKLRRILWALCAAALVSLFSLAGGSLASYLSVKSTAEDATVLAQQIQKECATPATLSPDLSQFCPKADQVVEAAPSSVKADQVPGPPGPSGSPGTDGGDGSTGPQGPAGLNGKNGKNGAQGVSGALGPAGQNGSDGKDAVVTLDQIKAAFAVFCVDDFCTGPPGPKGDKGEKGDTGDKGEKGDTGPEGPPVNVNNEDQCGPAPEGQYIYNVDTSYDSATQTFITTCSYRDDQTSTPILGNNRSTR